MATLVQHHRVTGHANGIALLGMLHQRVGQRLGWEQQRIAPPPMALAPCLSKAVFEGHSKAIHGGVIRLCGDLFGSFRVGIFRVGSVLGIDARFWQSHQQAQAIWQFTVLAGVA